MKEEKLLLAMEGIGDDLIAQAMEPPRRMVQRTWLRWAAAAACLCLLLASPVGAVAESLYKFISANGLLEHSTLDRLPVEMLSDEALAAFPDECGETNYITKDSLTDAEEYLGIDLPENSVLEAADWDEIHIETADGERIDSHCIIYLSTGEQPEPYCVDADVAYHINGIPVQVMYSCTTERNPYDNGGGVILDPEQYDAEHLTTPGGREWDLYFKVNGQGYATQALTNVNGTLVWVRVWDAPLIDSASLRDIMIDIMEAYD